MVVWQIQSHVTSVLYMDNEIPKEDFARNFYKRYSRSQKYIANDNHYFDGIYSVFINLGNDIKDIH